jgi:hypothetical protein
MEDRLQDGWDVGSSLPGFTRQTIKLSKAFFQDGCADQIRE